VNHQAYSIALLALASICAHAGNDPYGLLFTTPDQRARLDNRFTGGNDISAPQSGETGAETQVVRPLKLNGTLVSSVGKKEVWINGERQLAPGENQNGRVRLLNVDRVRIKSAASSRAHDLKPGQVLDPATGNVTEAYQQAVKPPSPAGDAP